MADAHRDLSPADVDGDVDQCAWDAVDHRAHLQLADAEDANDAGHRVAEHAGGGELATDPRPHGAKLGRHAGKRVDERAFVAQGDAGRDPGRRHGSRPLRQKRLATRDGEHLGERRVPALGQVARPARDHRERLRVLLEPPSRRRGDGRRGEVVVGRAQSAADDDHGGLEGQRLAQRRHQQAHVVGHHGETRDLDAVGGEARGEKSAVGVAGASVEELVPGQHDDRLRQFRPHRAVPGRCSRSRAFQK